MDASHTRAVAATDHFVPCRTGQVLAHFTFHAEVDPSVLPRILQAFALRNLTPYTVACRQAQGWLRIDLTVFGLERREIDHLTLRLDQIVPVRAVRSWTSEGPA